MALSEQKQTSLIPLSDARPNGKTSANGHGHKQTALVVGTPKPDVQANGKGHLLTTGDAPAAQGALELERIGWRGWWRTLQVVRVMWLLSSYLFLENYEARSKYNRRMSERGREAARTQDRKARFRAWRRDVIVRVLDRLIRTVRFIVFRGADESQSKEARLARQGAWFKRSLI